MELWKAAFAVAGLGAVAAFVIWSLYKQWLQLPIFQTLTKHHQYQLFRLFLILTFLFAIAGLVAFVFATRPNHTEPEIQLRVIDSKTQQPIHQQLVLSYRRGARTFDTKTRSGMTNRIPGDFNEITDTTVDNLEGYLWNESYIDDPAKRIRTFSLSRREGVNFERDRDKSFADTIRPSKEALDGLIRDSEMDDKEKYLAEMATIPNDLPPKVELKCQNNTSYAVDVFWYRYAPPALGRNAGFNPGWRRPVTSLPTDGKFVTLVDSIELSPGGYFYIFGSRNGLEGDYLAEGNVFRSAVALLVIDPEQKAGVDMLRGNLINTSSAGEP